ncbi:MAG: DNA translocase FtsK [Oscillospiraceae bacterium]
MANSTKQSKPKTKPKTGGARTASKAAPAKKSTARPIRREIGGLVCLLLALCVTVSYFQIPAIFIDWIALLLKGLFGGGYYLAAPALVIAGLILLRHQGRPVCFRVTCALLSPVFAGTLLHLILCKETYASSLGILKTLWVSGLALVSGGAVSGALAVGFIAVFSKVASIILFSVLLALSLGLALRLTIAAVVTKMRERDRLEYEEIPLPEPVRPVARTKPVIDIPLDGTPLAATTPPAPAEAPVRTGFFRRREAAFSPVAPTVAPDAVSDSAPIVPPIAPIAAPAVPTAAPPVTPPVAPLVPPEFAGERKPKAVAAEIAAATEAVAQEIETKQADETAYQAPPISLLDESHSDNFTEAGAELRENSRRLTETLASFGVDAKPGDVVHGPSVTRYEFVLDQGVKLSKLTNLSDDIALALGASGVRIAPIPDKSSVVGIEVPNKQVSSVLIRDVLDSKEFTRHKSNVAFAVGKDIGGNNIIGNIAKLPHVLIAGTTGSGKSVCTNSLIISLLYKSTPDEVRFIMVDPKMVELAPYNGIPHLLIPVVTDPKKAAGALQWAVFEMMKRYKAFSENGVKDLASFNALAARSEELKKLPTVVVVIDELADLMLVAAKEVEESICRVAQMGRAAGMHLVIATQRPSADVITGIMKANIPSRIAFAVASSLESRIILDTQGAEKLVGRGDMLYFPLGSGKPLRVQGCLISPEEIERVVAFAKQSGEADYSDEVIQKIEETLQEKEKGNGSRGNGDAVPENEEDELLPAAVEVVLETGQASVSMLQRRLKLGYSRAARVVDQMEERGIVGPFEGSKPRQLLITRAQWQEKQLGGVALPQQEIDLPQEPEDAIDENDEGDES